jgi:hypothetical protein
VPPEILVDVVFLFGLCCHRSSIGFPLAPVLRQEHVTRLDPTHELQPAVFAIGFSRCGRRGSWSQFWSAPPVRTLGRPPDPVSAGRRSAPF